MKEPSENSYLKAKFEDFRFPVRDEVWDGIAGELNSSSKGFLGAKFGHYAHSPDPKVWERIADARDSRSRRRAIAWWWYAAASILIGTLIGYTLIDRTAGYTSSYAERSEMPFSVNGAEIVNDNSTASTVSDDSTRRDEGISLTEGEGQNDIIPSLNSITPGHHSESEMMPYTSSDKKNSFLADGFEKYSDVEENLALDATSFQPSSAQPSLWSQRPTSLNLVPAIIKGAKIEQSESEPEFINELRHLTTSTTDEKLKKATPFYNGMEQRLANDFTLLAGRQFAPSPEGDLNDFLSANENNNYPTFGMGTGNQFSPTITYKAPVIYGVNAEMKLWKRFALGTGFAYMNLESKTELADGSGAINRQISRNYLSVPLYLKFNFVDKRRFASYLTAGNGVDFLLSERVATHFTGNTQFAANSFEQDGEKGLQANVFAGVGLQWKLTKNLGLFTEGNVLHYYKVDRMNFYSQTVVWPAWKFGILVSF